MCGISDSIDALNLRVNMEVEMRSGSVIEYLVALTRRALMLSMKSPSMTTLAISFNALVEVLMRSTIKERDSLLRKITGRKYEVQADSAHIANLKQAALSSSTFRSMVIESTAIISRFIGVYFLESHRSIFALGFPSPGDIGTTLISFNFALELVSEIIVDFIVGLSLIKQGISLDKYYNTIQVATRHAHFIAVIIFGNVGALIILTNTPNFYFARTPTSYARVIPISSTPSSFRTATRRIRRKRTRTQQLCFLI